MKNWILPLALSLVTSAVSGQGPCLGTARVQSIGVGTSGIAGVPTLGLEGAPVPGWPFALRVQNGAPNALGILVASNVAAPSAQPLPQFLATFYPSTAVHVLPFQLDGNGVSAPLHSSSALGQSLCGRNYVAQAGILDSGATGGVSFTQGLAVGVGSASSGLLNLGAAQNFATGQNPVSVGITDLNDDGIPDVAVANRVSNSVSILLGAGDGSFGAAQNFAVGNGPRSVGISDLNGDGIPDLAVANAFSLNVSILLGF